MSQRDEDGPKDASRRKVLAGLGVLGAGAAVVGCRPRWTPPEDDPTGVARNKPYVPGAEAYGTGEERFTTTSCGQCPAGCGLRIRVVEGRAVRVEGNQTNPINLGGVGPRGLSSLQVLYDPDRIQQPMIRRDGVLKPASWVEAMSLVTNNLNQLRTAGRAGELRVISGRARGMMNDLLARFCAAYGAPAPANGLLGREAPLVAAMRDSLGGSETPAYDWTRASFVLSLEAGLFEDSCQAMYLARVAAELRRPADGRRPTVVHLGPRYDLNAYNADRFIQVRPGTSGAFALGVCNELLSMSGEAARLGSAHSEGFEGFVALAAGYTPDRVAEITGAPADEVGRVARGLVSAPSFAVVDERSVDFTNGADTARVALALNALLGALESGRGGVRLPVSTPIADWPAVSASAPAGPAPRSHAEALAGLEGAAAALLYYTNPVYARAEPARWREALSKVPLVVSFSPFLDETTAEVAHVVLPDATFLERYEDATPAPAVPRGVMGVRQPVVAPLLDTRATGDVVIELAQALGGPVGAAFPWGNFREAMEARLLGLHEAGRGTVRAPTSREFLSTLYDAGAWAEVADAPPQLVPHRFPATWAEPAWQGDPNQYPIRMLVYRPLGSAEGTGANQPWLRTLRPHPGARPWRPVATMHPDAAPVGVSDGDLITIESELGSASIAIRLDRHIDPDTIAVPSGGGHTAFGRVAQRAGGVNPMLLLSSRVDLPFEATCRMRVRVRKGGSHA